MGYQYLRARYYDPGTGRFISKDPFSGALERPQTLTAYPYVQNNPVNFTDPSGMCPWCVASGVIGALAGGIVAATQGGDKGEIFRAAALGGAVGFVAGIPGGGIIASAMVGGGTGLATGFLNHVWVEKKSPKSYRPSDALRDTLTGAGGGLLGGVARTVFAPAKGAIGRFSTFNRGKVGQSIGSGGVSSFTDFMLQDFTRHDTVGACSIA